MSPRLWSKQEWQQQQQQRQPPCCLSLTVKSRVKEGNSYIQAVFFFSLVLVYFGRPKERENLNILCSSNHMIFLFNGTCGRRVIAIVGVVVVDVVLLF